MGIVALGDEIIDNCVNAGDLAAMGSGRLWRMAEGW